MHESLPQKFQVEDESKKNGVVQWSQSTELIKEVVESPHLPEESKKDPRVRGKAWAPLLKSKVGIPTANALA